MHAQVLTIEWHEDRAPIYSVHFNPVSNLFATAGQDCRVLLWQLSGTSVSHVSTLEEHVSTVNCVRWSPNGHYLASATDGGDTYGAQLLIWAEEPLTKVWRAVCRIQVPRDIYDICWNPQSTQIVCAGTDSRVRIYDAKTGSLKDEWATHSHYVQGVAWDPRGELVASLSMDRTLVLHTLGSKTSRKIKDMTLENGDQVAFLDDKATNYFRRLSFTPDGGFLVCPTATFGSAEQPEQKCSVVFTRRGLAMGMPCTILPTTSTHPTIAVSCSPCLYKSSAKLVAVEYACIYAVVTQFLVVIYSTQEAEPLCAVGNLHPTALTDLTWSNCGKKLILSSMEGFCSIIELPELEVQSTHAVAPTPTPSTSEPAALAPEAPVQQTINTLIARKKT